MERRSRSHSDGRDGGDGLIAEIGSIVGVCVRIADGLKIREIPILQANVGNQLGSPPLLPLVPDPVAWLYLE